MPITITTVDMIEEMKKKYGEGEDPISDESHWYFKAGARIGVDHPLCHAPSDQFPDSPDYQQNQKYRRIYLELKLTEAQQEYEELLNYVLESIAVAKKQGSLPDFDEEEVTQKLEKRKKALDYHQNRLDDFMRPMMEKREEVLRNQAESSARSIQAVSEMEERLTAKFLQ